MKVDAITHNDLLELKTNIKFNNKNIFFGANESEDFHDYNNAVINRDKILSIYLKESRVSFLDSIKYFFKTKEKSSEIISKLISEIGNNHRWTKEERNSIEGLQFGLKSFEGMNIHEVYLLLEYIKMRGLTLPIVRGCHNNCAHCYLDAKAPIMRISYEDFNNCISDIHEMYKRLKNIPLDDKEYIQHNRYVSLFYDSDGSDLYLYDKNGNLHEFPEIAHSVRKNIGRKCIFDTVGWNPKSVETQKRMEKLVEYYYDNRDILLDDVYSINLSINPFHSIRVTALKQKEKGNIESYEKLNKIYLDMVANMLNTFAPLITSSKLKILSRAYSDNMGNVKLDHYRVSDMNNLKNEILKRFEEKYPETIQKYPKILSDINRKFDIAEWMGKSARNNPLKDFSVNDERDYKLNNDSSIKDVKNYLVNNISMKPYIDLNGDIYFTDDFFTLKTNLKLNFENKITKPVYPKIFRNIEFSS